MVTKASFLFWFNVVFFFWLLPAYWENVCNPSFLNLQQGGSFLLAAWVCVSPLVLCWYRESHRCTLFCLLQIVIPACHHTQLAPWLGQLAGLCCLGSGDTSPMQHVSSLKSGLTVRVGHGGKVQFSLPKWSEKKKRSLSWAWQRFGSAGCFWWLSVEGLAPQAKSFPYPLEHGGFLKTCKGDGEFLGMGAYPRLSCHFCCTSNAKS